MWKPEQRHQESKINATHTCTVGCNTEIDFIKTSYMFLRPPCGISIPLEVVSDASKALSDSCEAETYGKKSIEILLKM